MSVSISAQKDVVQQEACLWFPNDLTTLPHWSNMRHEHTSVHVWAKARVQETKTPWQTCDWGKCMIIIKLFLLKREVEIHCASLKWSLRISFHSLFVRVLRVWVWAWTRVGGDERGQKEVYDLKLSLAANTHWKAHDSMKKQLTAAGDVCIADTSNTVRDSS